MATTSYGTPYVQSSDLVSGWPNASLNVANRIDQVSYAGNGINAQTGTSYTLAVTDAGKLVTLNNAAAVAVSLPQDSTANLPVGSVTRIYNLGAGVVTVQAGSGATLQGGSVTVAQYDACDVTKLSANTYGIAAAAGGLVLISTNSFTSASSVILSNCFSSTYDNYRIIVRVASASGVVAVNLRLRLGGSDSATTYTTQQLQVTGTTVGAGRTGASNTGTEWQLANTSASLPVGISVDLFGPAIAAATSMQAQSNYPASGGSIELYAGTHSTATAYDSMSLLTSSGSMTGSVFVYGYKN